MTPPSVARSLAASDLDLAGDDHRLTRTRAVLVDGLRARLEEHRQALLAELSATRSGATTPEPTVGGDTELHEGRREMVEALLEIGLRAIERGEPWDGPLPPAVGAQARRAAVAGMSVTSVLDRCMVGFSLVRDFFFVELERHELSRGDEHLLWRQASQVLDPLRQGVLTGLEQAYEQARTRQTYSRQQLRAEIAERILEGATPTPDELVDLGHDLDAWHLAVIGTGAGAKRVVRRLRGHRAGARRCRARRGHRGRRGASERTRRVASHPRGGGSHAGGGAPQGVQTDALQGCGARGHSTAERSVGRRAHRTMPGAA